MAGSIGFWKDALCLWSLFWLNIINLQSDSVLKVICGFLLFFKSFKGVIWKNFFAPRLSSVIRTVSVNLVKSFIDAFPLPCLNLNPWYMGKKWKLCSFILYLPIHYIPNASQHSLLVLWLFRMWDWAQLALWGVAGSVGSFEMLSTCIRFTHCLCNVLNPCVKDCAKHSTTGLVLWPGYATALTYVCLVMKKGNPLLTHLRKSLVPWRGILLCY